MIFDIQHFSLSDGPGIRTTVFFKGCPLRCLWCHTPESQRKERELMFTPERCIGCGRCVPVCPRACHRMEKGIHRFDRSRCTGCGRCAENCFPGALESCGDERTAEEILDEVEADRPLYEASGGGMTLSGGEPLFQAAFAEELCTNAKRRRLHICLDTSGFAPRETCRGIAPLVDLFLFDIKTVVPAKHRALTGVDNALILENLFLLDELKRPSVLRCPLVPGVNDSPEELAGIARLANRLRHVEEIDLEPYHPLGEGKRKSLGLSLSFQAEVPSPETVERWRSEIGKLTRVKIAVC